MSWFGRCSAQECREHNIHSGERQTVRHSRGKDRERHGLDTIQPVWLKHILGLCLCFHDVYFKRTVECVEGVQRETDRRREDEIWKMKQTERDIVKDKQME